MTRDEALMSEVSLDEVKEMEKEKKLTRSSHLSSSPRGWRAQIDDEVPIRRGLCATPFSSLAQEMGILFAARYVNRRLSLAGEVIEM
jgi:hypothetical protein